MEMVLHKHWRNSSGVQDLRHTAWKILQHRLNLTFSCQQDLVSKFGGKFFFSNSILTGSWVDNAMDIWIYVLLGENMLSLECWRQS